MLTRTTPAVEERLLRPSLGVLLRLVWTERSISRVELARRTDLARSTVTRSINALLTTGLVREVGVGPSRGGRRPILLEFQDTAYGVAGVELTSERVAVALTDLRGNVLAWEERPYAVRIDPDGARALAGELTSRCLERWQRSAERLVCIGVAVPSPVDRGAPTLLSPVDLPAWRGQPGLEPLAERFGVPVLLDNDANLGALGEHRWGAGQGADNVVYLTIGAGVGAGHVIQGRLYRGSTGVAGELSHFPTDPRGDPCSCGMRGCLSSATSANALVRHAERYAAANPGSPLARAPVTLDAVERAALAGDEAALRAIDEIVDRLANAIGTVLNLFNPARVVMGGDLLRLGELLLEPLRRAVRDRVRASSAGAARIVASTLGDRAIAIGAATMALEHALGDLRLFPPLRGVVEGRGGVIAAS